MDYKQLFEHVIFLLIYPLTVFMSFLTGNHGSYFTTFISIFAVAACAGIWLTVDLVEVLGFDSREVLDYG